MIVDGKIKLKSGSEIKHFTETGVLLEDGSRLDADVFAKIAPTKICLR